jgi:hypothetical protein
MPRRTSSLIVTVFWIAAVCSGATDPFVGKWKANASRSRIADQISIRVAGENAYTLAFSGSTEIETVPADGADHPGVYGTTVSLAVQGPGTWKFVRKSKGKMLLSAVWTLSGDGKTLTDAFTSYGPDGSPSTVTTVYRRAAGGAGFPGTWETTHAKLDPYELEIRPYEGGGLSFIVSNSSSPKNVTFDGKEHRNTLGAGVVAASAGRRIGRLELELTDKVDGKILATRRMTVSPDLKTLTSVVRPAGQRLPNTVVFDRE